MSLKLANLIYFLGSMVWSLSTFIVLLPDVKHYFYSKCVWKFNFNACDRFFGIEGAYRFTTSIVMFYIFLAVTTINCHSKIASRVHHSFWFFKVVLFALTNLVAFSIPFSRFLLEKLYEIFLYYTGFFMVAMFVLAVDSAHAFKLFWLRKARESMETPTCYLCTWLFILHLLTSFLFAISLDVLLTFVFFNNIQNCINTLLFAGINVCLCLICFCLSYFPTLQERHSSSHIIFASMFTIVTYVTWLALSDPENEFCNMYGTIFTGSILESAISFRSLISMAILFPPLCFLCFKGDTPSYIRSLISNANSTAESLHIYSSFHWTMAGASCHVIMSVTNYYEPVYTVLKPVSSTDKSMRTSVIYFEGYNRNRFIMLCIVSSFLPLLYGCLLTIRIIRDCLTQSRLKENENASKSKLDETTEEFIHVEVTREEALDLLKKGSNLHGLEQTEKSFEYLLLQCFYISSIKISFWLFPRNISQTYFNGRNGSNACTIISLIIGRFFSRSDIPYQNRGYLEDTWMNLFYASIKEGNILYDSIVEELGVLDLSIEEVNERLGTKLNILTVMPSLAVSFESDVKTATILYQLRQLVFLKRKQVVLFIHKRRTSSFLIYDDGNVIYTDSHAFGENGSLMIASTEHKLDNLVYFLKDTLGSNNNKLATLTAVVYEDRRRIGK